MKLLCWPDISVETGLGHLMRLISLAQKVPKAEFYCAPLPSAIREFKKNGFLLHGMPPDGSVEFFLSLLKDRKPDWVALDGYIFDHALRSDIRATGCHVLSLDDDYGPKPRYSSLIVNQNMGASADLYKDLGAVSLVGSDYCLLRNEILESRSIKKTIPDVAQNILLTMGGSDPNNETQKLLEQLKNVSHPLRVVLGPSNPHADSIQKDNLPAHITIESGTPIGNLLPWADLAITAGGTTCYELAYGGVPLICLPIVDNQIPVVAGLVAAGVGVTTSFDQVPILLHELINDKLRREKMSQAGQKMIDGLGRDRILQVMITISKGK